MSFLGRSWKYILAVCGGIIAFIVALLQWRRREPKVVQYKTRKQITKEEQDEIKKIENDAHDNKRDFDAWLSSHDRKSD